MGKIFAVGGGHWRLGERYETAVFDRRIIELTEKASPNFLFVGLAKKAEDRHFDVMKAIYGGMYGCAADELTDADTENIDSAAQKIAWADIIFVGGGNTSKLMKIFRKSGIDRLLYLAYEQGKVLCGVSAGGICWCRYGNSATGPEGAEIIRVEGLGLLDILFCPHSRDLKRIESLPEMLSDIPDMTAIALDNAALEVIDGNCRAVLMDESGTAQRFYIKNGTLTRERIAENVNFSIK